MNLQSMSIDRLIGLRSRVDAALGAKVVAERRTIETELSKLSRFQGGAARSKSAFGRTVAPKYRNPENPSETWAGRGLRVVSGDASGEENRRFPYPGIHAVAESKWAKTGR